MLNIANGLAEQGLDVKTHEISFGSFAGDFLTQLKLYGALFGVTPHVESIGEIESILQHELVLAPFYSAFLQPNYPIIAPIDENSVSANSSYRRSWIAVDYDRSYDCSRFAFRNGAIDVIFNDDAELNLKSIEESFGNYQRFLKSNTHPI